MGFLYNYYIKKEEERHIQELKHLVFLFEQLNKTRIFSFGTSINTNIYAIRFFNFNYTCFRRLPSDYKLFTPLAEFDYTVKQLFHLRILVTIKKFIRNYPEKGVC